ncbi:hypothetical protein [Natronolimnohabitans innermongolicus]|uniref:Flagellin n=1 Tax=Natronolimnohabitans innermongolicus JCM 12255 TaxID=1227499 RepID=L9XGA9_9EURY|nr:hypothetical protein [Natronolimnohabitans innermongolicus]ELY60755.1 hypothetical protein C493_03597 [Natronolimnohabitans innermongolicus JCM 12255]
MVTDRTRTRRTDCSSEGRPDRGQVILIGAIALAFIILGVVVVFNGVLYTETLSSADTGQSGSDAEVTELEIEQGIGCLLERLEDEHEDKEGDVNNTIIKQNISSFAEHYRNATAHSSPKDIHIEYVEEGTENVTVSVSYTSSDLNYDRELTIEPGCPA